MISASISAAAAMRKLGLRTNFGIIARDAPPRPMTPTPKTLSLAAIDSSFHAIVTPARSFFRCLSKLGEIVQVCGTDSIWLQRHINVGADLYVRPPRTGDHVGSPLQIFRGIDLVVRRSADLRLARHTRTTQRARSIRSNRSRH